MLQKLVVLIIAVYGLCMAVHPNGHGEQAVQPSAPEVASYVGNYQIPPGEVARITAQNGEYFLDLNDGAIHKLIQMEAHTFQVDADSIGAGSLQFMMGEDGQAVGFMLSSGEGSQLVAERVEAGAITLFGKIRVE